MRPSIWNVVPGSQQVRWTKPSARVAPPSSTDEVTVPVHRVLADGIPDNEFLIFGNSSHVILKEKEADAYMGVVRDFVRRRRAG